MSDRFKVLNTPIENLLVLQGTRILDERGFFVRKSCSNEFENFKINHSWSQINLSSNRKKGTLRGMHYQVAPFEEIKLVSCIKGSIIDVAVDMRPNSKTYRKFFNIELSERNEYSLYIPQGFAHGFQTLENDSEILYMSSGFYNPECERGLRYDDSILDLSWPLPVSEISEKDLTWPLL